MAVTCEDVRRVAALARLKFTEDELDAFAVEMNSILAFFSQLADADTKSVEPVFRVLRRSNVFREDVVSGMLSRDEALANAPDRAGDSFRVPAVLPDE